MSHLMYADDLIIYCRAKEGEATTILKYLDDFCACSGQQINFNKSSIHFSCNTKSTTKLNILRILGKVEYDHKGSYLRLPFYRNQFKRANLNVIAGK